MNPDLQHFVRDALARGIDRATITRLLREAGWRPEEVEAALAACVESDFPIPVPRRRPYLSAREAFLYLVLFATLYTSAIQVGVILFQLVNHFVPEAGRLGEAPRQIADLARNAVAALVIAFPIFALTARFIGRGVALEPEKRGSKVRKWLTYVTLFVAAMVIVGDLTFLVSRLLGGELPGRALLKVVVVFAVAGTVFSHYLGELRRDEREGAAPLRELRLPSRLVGALVVVAAIAGLLLAGSPRRERQRQLDAQRIEHLRGVASRVNAWAWERRRLPASLDDLLSEPGAYDAQFRDPATGVPYDYRILDSLSYELCATFDAADSSDGVRDPERSSRFWRHGVGRACYTLSVPARSLEPGAVERPRP